MKIRKQLHLSAQISRIFDGDLKTFAKLLPYDTLESDV